jgi:chemotaxis protein methyltransferase WspC
MALTDFEQLLKTAIGLDAGSVGPSSIERAVQERLTACGLIDRHAYWEVVRSGGTELQALIEEVVVAETWFFRDREAFAMLASIGHERWLRGPADGRLRLLSLPSSTGEEPYSMAMALLDTGIPADRFRIDAVDVSARGVAQGERAVYGRNSFRGHDLAFRDRHFSATALGYHPDDTVRRQVHFRQGNLFAADFLPGLDLYDVIFCRNLLIYFDRPMQDRAVAVLQRLLTPDGTLFVAPSETGLLLSHDFESAKVPLAFAFHKSAAGGGDPTPAVRSAIRPVRPATHRQTPFPIASPVSVHQATRVHLTAALPQPLPPPDRRAGLQAGLEDAVRLANQGDLDQAATCCEDHLRRHGPSANAFHLLGLVRDAAGNPTDASKYYRKALYLDPEHHETLVHFAFLVEQQGDRAAAQVLRNRARRVEQHGKA